MSLQLALSIVAAIGSCISAVLLPYYYGRLTEKVSNLRRDVDKLAETQEEHGETISKHTTKIALLENWREGFAVGSMRQQHIHVSTAIPENTDGTPTV